jgi:archaellum component FlaC
MAKEKNNLDQFFREKLNQDSITPSNLAWERLESQLPKQEKSKTPVIWWSIAASVAALFVAGYFTLTLSSDPSVEPILASSEENQIEEVIQQTEEIPTEISPEIPAQPEEKTTIIKKTKPTNSISQKPASIQVNTPASNLIAVAEEKSEVKTPDRKVTLTPLVEELELPTLALPNLEVNQTLAEVIEKPEAEEPAYRVRIYSDGIKEDKSLIEGISKKVDQVEGLLGKVDQGFADLQDAKNNFFTALLTKKEKVAEKP